MLADVRVGSLGDIGPLSRDVRFDFRDRCDGSPDLKHRGPNVWFCDASFRKGQDMGWFQHGSIVIVFAPKGFSLSENVEEGAGIRMEQPPLRLPQAGG